MPTNNTYKQLVDRLDGQLSQSELEQTEQLINNDQAVAGEWQQLLLVTQNIREAGIYEQVSTVRQEFASATMKATSPPKVVTMRSKFVALKIAAVLLLVGIAATMYKFTSVTNQSMYETYYNSYELGSMRARGEVNAIEHAYRNGDWQAVITNASATDNKESFLAGMAAMELKNYSKAITAFNRVIDEANITGNRYFKDESEYYLAMSYLAANDGKKAMQILEAILADKAHLFHNRVEKMGIDVKVLGLKN
ncbi:MAG: tetratricopeptide repeat protein [Chitinophagaceae bacterium]|nr:MAG: tetratricopeptide repeat protein [Chitinophagaceae bacterium]